MFANSFIGPENFLEYCTNCATPPRVMKNIPPTFATPLEESIYKRPPSIAISERETLLIKFMVGPRVPPKYSAS